MIRRALAVLALVAAGVVLGPAAVAPAFAATPADAPQPDEVWFGPDLDWTNDAPDGYAGRLGETPSMYELTLPYPISEDAAAQWRTTARAVATQGAVLVLSFLPSEALGDLTASDAEAAESLLAEMHDQYGTQQLLRFAPEMNGTWISWGQQPNAYVDAFTLVADTVHAGDSGALMVWAPSYGSGYPFGLAEGRLDSLSATDLARLDTDGDGDITESDDPYAPYFPGDDAVDWVGQTMFYFGKGEATASAGVEVPLTENQAAVDTEVEQRFTETWGYTVAQDDNFYDRFAVEYDLPLLLDTGALYDDELDGATETDVKRGWWRQVLTAASDRPLIKGITWLEAEREEAEAGGDEVDWRATDDPQIAAALLDDLRAHGGIEFGPVTEVVSKEQGNAATVQVREDGTSTGGDQMSFIVWCAAGLAIAFLLSGLIGKFAPSWRYVDDGSSSRDLRIDLFRGFIILAVVVTHIEVAGALSYVTLQFIGAITGAEMFVFLSGLVLGMVYPLGVRKFGELKSATGALRRAGKQYTVTIVVILVVFALSFVPFLGAAAITTFTDRGTGLDGLGAEGTTYDLYPNADRLLDYPPPWYAVRQLLLLEMGPWPFNIMGLFVVLSVTIPAAMWLLKRKLWWVLLAVSWGLYLWRTFVPDAPALPSQFEAVFPLFLWQVLFAHGLVVGYYRKQITRALTSLPGRIITAVVVVGYAGFLVYLWAGYTYGFEPTPFPVGFYDSLYGTAYQRVDMQWGRLADVVLMVVCTYAILTAFWKPINAAIGWLWIPLGQASLYVFVWQVFFALAVASIPGLDRSNVWLGTGIHIGLILLVWFMVKKKFMFKIIPR
nr:OpgC domain-containing protein [Conyzicola lurida]